jgi:hypothetical protein
MRDIRSSRLGPRTHPRSSGRRTVSSRTNWDQFRPQYVLGLSVIQICPWWIKVLKLGCVSRDGGPVVHLFQCGVHEPVLLDPHSGYTRECGRSREFDRQTRSEQTANIATGAIDSRQYQWGSTPVTVPTPLLWPSRKTKRCPSVTRYGWNLNRTVASPVSPGRSFPSSG